MLMMQHWPISKKTIEHPAALARLKLDGRDTEKLARDLEHILEYVGELNAVDTEGVLPMTGGTRLLNVLREDGAVLDDDTGKGVGAFPESEDGFLKVPPVFE